MTIECQHPQQVNHYVNQVAGSLGKLVDVDNPTHHVVVTYGEKAWSVYNVGTEVRVKDFIWVEGEFTVIEQDPPIIEEPEPIEEEPVEEDPIPEDDVPEEEDPSPPEIDPPDHPESFEEDDANTP